MKKKVIKKVSEKARRSHLRATNLHKQPGGKAQEPAIKTEPVAKTAKEKKIDLAKKKDIEATRHANALADHCPAMRDCRDSSLAKSVVASLKGYVTLIGLSVKDSYHALFQVNRGGFVLPPLRRCFDVIASILSVEKQPNGEKLEYLITDKKAIKDYFNTARKAHEAFMKKVVITDTAKHAVRGRKTESGAYSYAHTTRHQVGKDKLEKENATDTFRNAAIASDAILFANASRHVMSLATMAGDKANRNQFSLWRKLRPADSKLPAYVTEGDDLARMMNADTNVFDAFAWFVSQAKAKVSARREAMEKAAAASLK
jgi:hypothetical protein